MKLQELGLKHRTDKSVHTFDKMTYLDIYEKYFSGIRESVKTFVEFGVLEGNSLRMWSEYFPNATIHGVDIDPRCKANESDRIKVHIGNQNDQNFLNALKNELGQVDIILDDGSHITRHQIKTFDTLYDLVNYNGFYVIEDLRNSYEEILNKANVRENWTGMSYNDPSDSLENYRHEFNEFIQEKVKKLDFHVVNKLLSIHHYPMIVIFENIKK